jgi:hypothetical protein
MGDVVVASTTDNQEEVNAAAGGAKQDVEQPELKPPPTGDEQVESKEPEVKAPEPEPEEKPAKNLSKKFDKLYREKKELEERLAAVEARQNGQPKEEAKPQPEIPVEVAAKFDTFDSWSEKQLAAGKPASIDDFLEARDAWKDARRAQQEEKQAIAEMQQEIANAYQEKVDIFKASVEDWDEVVGQEIGLPPGIVPAILELENGPEVAYFLGKNHEVTQKLNELSPHLAIAEVGRIAGRLEKTPVPLQETNNTATRSPDRTPTVSKAPAPIAPLKGAGVRISKDLSDPNMPYDEYRKIRDEQAKQRFRR